MAQEIKIGEPIDLGQAGYVSLPGDVVVTSGRYYIVRHEGPHHDAEGLEFEGVKELTPAKPAAPKPNKK